MCRRQLNMHAQAACVVEPAWIPSKRGVAFKTNPRTKPFTTNHIIAVVQERQGQYKTDQVSTAPAIQSRMYESANS